MFLSLFLSLFASINPVSADTCKTTREIELDLNGWKKSVNAAAQYDDRIQALEKLELGKPVVACERALTREGLDPKQIKFEPVIIQKPKLVGGEDEVAVVQVRASAVSKENEVICRYYGIMVLNNLGGTKWCKVGNALSTSFVKPPKSKNCPAEKGTITTGSRTLRYIPLTDENEHTIEVTDIERQCDSIEHQRSFWNIQDHQLSNIFTTLIRKDELSMSGDKIKTKTIENSVLKFKGDFPKEIEIATRSNECPDEPEKDVKSTGPKESCIRREKKTYVLSNMYYIEKTESNSNTSESKQ